MRTWTCCSGTARGESGSVADVRAAGSLPAWDSASPRSSRIGSGDRLLSAPEPERPPDGCRNQRDQRSAVEHTVFVHQGHVMRTRRNLERLESAVGPQQPHRLIIHVCLPVVVKGLGDDDQRRLGARTSSCTLWGENCCTDTVPGDAFETVTRARAASGRKTVRRGSNSGAVSASTVPAGSAKTGFCPAVTQGRGEGWAFQWLTWPGALTCEMARKSASPAGNRGSFHSKGKTSPSSRR